MVLSRDRWTSLTGLIGAGFHLPGAHGCPPKGARYDRRDAVTTATTDWGGGRDGRGDPAFRATPRGRGHRCLRPRVPQRRPAGRDRRGPPARGRQLRAHPVPRADAGAQRLHRRAVAVRPRAPARSSATPCPRSSPGSSRSTSRSSGTRSPARSASASPRAASSAPAGSGCAAAPTPRSRRSSGQRMTETAIRSSEVVIEVNGMRHPLTPPGVVDRPRQQRRPADRRPRHLAPARADLAQGVRGRHRSSPCPTSAPPTA